MSKNSKAPQKPDDLQNNPNPEETSSEEVSMEEEIANLSEEKKAEFAKKLGQIKADRILESENPHTETYFMFATPDCGTTNLTVVGHSFPVFSCKTGKDLTGQDVEIPERGGFEELTESEAERMKNAIIDFGLRFVGKGSSKFRRNGKRYNQHSEFPIAMFLGFYKVKELNKLHPGGWRENVELPTLMERDKEALRRFGNGWRDSKGNKIPLMREFREDKTISKDYTSAKK